MNSLFLLVKRFLFVSMLACFTLNISAEKDPVSNVITPRISSSNPLKTSAESTTDPSSKTFYLGAIIMTSDIQTGVSTDKKAISQINVYPNPAKEMINIELDANSYSTVNIEIYNLIGEKVLELQPSVSEGDNLVSVLINNLLDGVYLLKVFKGSEVSCRKFIISK